MVKITDFFGLENLIHYHADISPKEAFFIQTLFFRDEGRGGGRGWQTVFCPPVLIVCIAFDLGRVVRGPINQTWVLFSIVQKYFPG